MSEQPKTGRIIWNGLFFDYRQQPYDGGPYSGEVELSITPEIIDHQAFENHLMEIGYDEDEYPICANVACILVGVQGLLADAAQELADNPPIELEIEVIEK